MEVLAAIDGPRGSTSVLRTARQSASGLPDAKPHEPDRLNARLVEDLLDRLLAVLGERLLDQHGVLVEAAHPTLDDLGQRSLGLALFAGSRLGDAALVLDDIRRDLVTGQVRRREGRDVLSDVLADLGVLAVELNQDAELWR